MNFRLALSALSLGFAFLAINGCTADAGSGDDGDAEEASASQDEITAATKKLTGAFHLGDGSNAATSFTGLVLQSDGTFFADADTGIRCVRAPCPSSVRLEGTFTATRSYVRLTAKAGAATDHAADFYGRYKYSADGEALVLSRTKSGSTWSQSLAKETSYCAQPTDCGAQGLMHPMCAPGGWTCGGGAKANTCGFSCGTPASASIWPAEATKLVAESKGGGFAPTPPAGSTCSFGQQKLSFDRATRVLTAEVCTPAGAGKPLALKASTTTLTASEVAKVETALTAATVSHANRCGADKAILEVVVSLPSGDKTYTDSFYGCQGGNHTYLDGIDAIFSALHDAQ
ncbi:MAG: hypothetical protein JWP97_6334 [Labilithrix sp.]|nr:hypothetical protein [Labilithrix sp.]